MQDYTISAERSPRKQLAYTYYPKKYIYWESDI